MLNSLLSLFLPLRRRWLYVVMTMVVAIGVNLTVPRVSHAGLFDVILRGVQIIQIDNMSDRQEAALGRRINNQMVGREFRLYTNAELNSYVNDIGQRMAQQSERPPSADMPYIFQIVSDPSINAFATMGGYVYVTTGLMAAADNEAQLASVIGHEIGHVASRHSLEQLRDALVAQGVADLAGLESNAAVGIGVDLALRRPNSRRDEYEADERGLRALILSGYAPEAMPRFMEKLVGQASPPTFLSTHPNARNRVERLEEAIADPEELFEDLDLDDAARTDLITNLQYGSDGLDEAFYTNKIRRLRS